MKLILINLYRIPSGLYLIIPAIKKTGSVLLSCENMYRKKQFVNQRPVYQFKMKIIYLSH